MLLTVCFRTSSSKSTAWKSCQKCHSAGPAPQVRNSAGGVHWFVSSSPISGVDVHSSMRTSDWDQGTFSFPDNGDEQSSYLVDRFLRSQERDLRSCRSRCPTLTMANSCKLPHVLERCVNSTAILPLRDGLLRLRHWRLLACFWHSHALSWLWLSSTPCCQGVQN